MQGEGRGISTTELFSINSPAAERCNCPPLSSLHREFRPDQDEAGEFIPVTPATPELSSYLRTALATFFPRSSPISVLLLHISQLEHIYITPKAAIFHKRHRYHAPASFLEQIVTNVRRTIRSSDQIVLHAGTGGAVILPDVDQEGAFGVVERIFHSINLLQPETVIPPLKRETDIFIGLGSYPKPGESLEELLYHTGCVAHRLTLRPAVNALSTKPAHPGEIDHDQQGDEDTTRTLQTVRTSGIPFMQLPSRLPQRLKHLIPYQLACELRCAPVGRDHNRLTVAMAHPTDIHAINLLRLATGMVIFPVACEVLALDSLLTHGW